MYRYIAFSWNSKDSTKTTIVRRLTGLLLSTSPDWKSVLDVPGLRILHAPHPGGACHAYVLKQDAGVVLGRLFDSSLSEGGIPSDPAFNDRESELVIESQGRRLVERYWGHYVAFLRGSGGQVRYVLRDPTGGLPCYLIKATGIDIVLSDMEDCVRLNLPSFSTDWEHLTAFLLNMRLVTRATGFKEVTQLYAGECIAIEDSAITSKATRSFYWNPAQVYETNVIEDLGEAKEALRNTIKYCVNAWASSYESIVLDLSGGLDSSIVAACLGNASGHMNILCSHFSLDTPEGDERPYARAAALSAGLELIETTAHATQTTLESQLEKSRVATPALLGFTPEMELLKRRLLTERQAAAVFTGQGGDQLFQQFRSELIAAEYIHRHGIRPKLLGIIKDTSRLTRRSFWSVLSAAMRFALLGKPYDPYAIFIVPSILTDKARASSGPDCYEHPWVQNATRLPAIKVRQIFDIVDSQMFYQQQYKYAEQIHPIISQPIIECCLRIPSYLLTCRGRPRGLVRDAFDADVPQKIIQRYTKTASTSYINRMLMENAEFLRQLLLDGALVREGILNRRELEKQLSERELILGKNLGVIINATRVETWLGNWAGARRHAAA